MSRPHKYRAKPCVIDGIRFASQAEGRRYQEWRLLEKAGEIRNIECHPRFPLVTIQHSSLEAKMAVLRATARGKYTPLKTALVGDYISDFRFEQRGLSGSENERWHTVIEDVKSPPTRTSLYRWKKTHTELQYGITIVEVET